jgi:hypothetical protein
MSGIEARKLLLPIPDSAIISHLKAVGERLGDCGEVGSFIRLNSPLNTVTTPVWFYTR